MSSTVRTCISHSTFSHNPLLESFINTYLMAASRFYVCSRYLQVFACANTCKYMYLHIKSTRFVFFKKSLFSRATETERLEHGMVRSTVN